MKQRRQPTRDDLKDRIEELIALADQLELPLVGAMLDGARSVVPTDLRH